MTERPFLHKYAFTNMFTNFIYHDEFINVFLKIINQKGIINIGRTILSVYNFAKLSNPKIKKKILKNDKIPKMPLKASMNLKKLNSVI